MNKYREMIHGMSNGQHDRAPEAVACILIGYSMMLNYFRDVGAIDNDTALKMLAHAPRWKKLLPPVPINRSA